MWGSRVGRHWLIRSLLGLVLVLSGTPIAWAQSRGSTAVRSTPELKALFKRMFDDPANVELTFKFAELATRVGDYEAAIGALTRILYFNPNLPRVKLQLGQLYFKLGAYKIARGYFQEARGGGAPADVIAASERFVAELDRREAPRVAAAPPPSEWSVFAQTGVRYQTNATQGPQGDIRSFGGTVPVNRSFAKQADYNWFGLLGATYVHNLKHGNEDAIEGAFFGYYANQFRLHAFDFGLMEAQLGPRFSVPIPGASVKPYAIGTVSTLGNAMYFAGGGPGFSARFKFDNKLVAFVEPAVEYRYRTFYDSTNFPASSQQTGGLLTASLRGQGAFSERIGWYGRFAFDRAGTAGDYDFNDYNDVSLDVGIPTAFDVDLGFGKRKVVLTPTAGLGYYSYRQANPSIDPAVVRKDHVWRAGAIVDAQIYERYGVRAQFLYTETRSTLSNFNVQNYSVLLGPTYSF